MSPLPEGYEAVIGLECHAQLRTATKMFCGCPVRLDAPPNTAVCPVCLGHPGVLPVANLEAVRLGIRAARCLGATVHAESVWARKNYFYPDLPKGYQISQHLRPLASGGVVHVRVGEAVRPFRIERLHLEEDAGRMVHGAGGSRVDWNRSGVPLLEIVGEPDVRTPEEAEAWLRMVHRVLTGSGVCEGALETGHLRCDVNVSVHRPGAPWGTRVEVKNVASFRFVARALRYEIQRQVAILDAGGTVPMETRTWGGGRTTLLRRKEGAADYRHFPEPDLPPLRVDDGLMAAAVAGLPGLPLDRWYLDQDRAERARLQADSGLDAATVEVLLGRADVAAFFRATLAEGGEPRAMANWIQKDVLRRSKESEADLEEARLRPGHLVALQRLLDTGTVNGGAARQVFEILWDEGGDPDTIVERLGLRQVSDEDALRATLRAIIAASPDQVRRYREGNRRMAGYFVGQLMKATSGRADPVLASRLLDEELAS